MGLSELLLWLLLLTMMLLVHAADIVCLATFMFSHILVAVLLNSTKSFRKRVLFVNYFFSEKQSI